MKARIEKSKDILQGEIEHLTQAPLTLAVAEKLSVFHGALMALCMLEEDRYAYEKRYERNHHEKVYGGHVSNCHEYDKGSYGKVTPRDDRSLRGWVEHMENADGTMGPHWTMDQAEKVLSQKQITMHPEAFWAALNMIYSDYCMVAAKMGVNNIDFYADMAMAFLNDKDAVPNKLEAYYKHVAKR